MLRGDDALGPKNQDLLRLHAINQAFFARFGPNGELEEGGVRLTAGYTAVNGLGRELPCNRGQIVRIVEGVDEELHGHGRAQGHAAIEPEKRRGIKRATFRA